MTDTDAAAVDASDADYLDQLAEHVGIGDPRAAPPRIDHAQVNGLRLRWLDWGDPAAPAIVLLHGGGQSARTWDACCLALATHRRCIAVDQRGHGDSQWSEAGGYAMEDHASDVAALIDRLGLIRPLVVGMSMGGINALSFATRHPDRLRGLVCVDVGPGLDQAPVDRLMRGLQRYRDFTDLDDAVARLSSMGARRSPTLLRQTIRHNLRRQGDRWTWKYDPRTLANLTAEQILAPRRKLWGVLGRLTCPVLVVRGGDSDIFSSAKADEFVGRLHDGRLKVVDGARHSVQTDRPKELAAVLAEFDAHCLSRDAR